MASQKYDMKHMTVLMCVSENGFYSAVSFRRNRTADEHKRYGTPHTFVGKHMCGYVFVRGESNFRLVSRREALAIISALEAQSGYCASMTGKLE